ncbi:hypothetical protein GCM10010399_76410 [Dactylosporangium fulvum]
MGRRFSVLLRDLSPLMAANVPGMVYRFVVGPDGSRRFLFVSPASRDIGGLEPDELLADADLLQKVFHPEDRALFAGCRSRRGRCPCRTAACSSTGSSSTGPRRGQPNRRSANRRSSRRCWPTSPPASSPATPGAR